MLQANKEASTAEKDIGGEHTLEVLILVRRVYWQTAPLLEATCPTHPILRLGFSEAFRRDGTWDRWSLLVRNHFMEMEDLRRVLKCPLYHISSNYAPELVLSELMRPVYVCLCTSSSVRPHTGFAWMSAHLACAETHSSSLQVDDFYMFRSKHLFRQRLRPACQAAPAPSIFEVLVADHSM